MKNNNNISAEEFEREIQTFNLGEHMDPEDLAVDIDMTSIDNDSVELATTMCRDLVDVYFNDEFMREHPTIKKRLDTEIESLRVLAKMRKSDEKIHDLAIKAIGANPSNASLYRSLSQIQTTLLSIQTKMDETIKNIQSICKNCQLELNFEGNQESPLNNPQVHRGTKSFIEQMQEDDNNNLFEDTTNE